MQDIQKCSLNFGQFNALTFSALARTPYTVLLQRDSRNEVCLQRINAYLRQEFDYELDHQEQVYLLIHLTKIVG